jgi:hypothetical protein
MHRSIWSAANRFVLNVDKTNIIKFITNNSPQYALYIGYTGVDKEGKVGDQKQDGKKVYL